MQLKIDTSSSYETIKAALGPHVVMELLPSGGAKLSAVRVVKNAHPSRALSVKIEVVFTDLTGKTCESLIVCDLENLPSPLDMDSLDESEDSTG